MYCLGILTKEGWECAKRKHEFGRNNRFTYEIRKNGIYAVIFYPSVPLADFIEDEFCGIICKDKKLVFMYIFIGLPALLSLFYLSYKM